MTLRKIGLTAISALFLAASPALANAKQGELAGAIDGEWISISGKVKSVSDETFKMSLGDRQITVEMDNYDWYDSQVLRTGDQVTVTGRMDNDFEEKKKIEASSVYIAKLNRYVYANPADEEDGYYYSYLYANPIKDDEWISVTGTVVRKQDDRLVLDTGVGDLDVDTGDLDAAGDRVAVGDRVSVYGEIDDADLFEDREILASSVIVLDDSL